ncbi:MAG TPA: helix-turn-helix transcriptional regulator [Jatrophihabitantaceae bacterium]|jgi:HTH-type transcriptional regulator/antitoxin HipB|nr:helix-turn-helix transcriptional regulator [Jatrophihabitantaceae bacterium]
MRVTTAQDLGNLVREKREAAGMTQRQLAELAGVRRLWLVHVEAGHPGAEFGRVLQLLASLDLTLDLVERRASAAWGDLLDPAPADPGADPRPTGRER